jgi:hypothetical protein
MRKEQGKRQGIGVYFQVSRNYQVLEEILTTKSKKSKKKEKKGPENKNLFDLFDSYVLCQEESDFFFQIFP